MVVDEERNECVTPSECPGKSAIYDEIEFLSLLVKHKKITMHKIIYIKY